MTRPDCLEDEEVLLEPLAPRLPAGDGVAGTSRSSGRAGRLVLAEIWAPKASRRARGGAAARRRL